ncbi:MAG: IS1182 family transposase [Actinobacteria bacterium]|nr:IS1182 family transposase [Actinomycetota bacterium]
MLRAADRQQGFFDAAWCADLLPADSIYALLAEHGDRIVRDEDFADCYSEMHGRPSIPPSVLARVLLLAYRHGLSDQAAMDAVRFDLRWKVALDLPIDHPGFHPTSLVRFRARLLLYGKERLVFERSIELATEFGLLEGPAEQIVDSTPMLGAAAVQDTAVLVRTAVGKLIDAVAATDKQAAKDLRRELGFDYARPRDKPEGDWTDRNTRMQLLGEVARDAQRALRAIGAHDTLADDETVAEAARVLGEIIGQEYETSDDDPPRPRGARRVRQIVSALDPEMRHGRQTPGRRFTGYKLHAAAAADAPIITAISVAPANEHDGHHAGALVDQQPAKRRPGRLIGDTAYGNSEAREDLAQRSISVLAPVHSSSPKTGAIPKDAFTIDLQTDTVTCPEGHSTPIYKPRANRRTTGGERVARFAREDCEPCPLRQRCAPGGQRDIRIRRREDLRQAALRELADPAERERLKRTRPRIERLLGLIVHRYHARKSRYLGSRKTTLQAAWTAVLVNLHPIAGALRAQTA